MPVAGAHRGKAERPADVARTAVKISAVLAVSAAVPALVIYGLVAGPELVTWIILAGIIAVDAYAIRAGRLDWPWWPARRKPAAPD